MSQGLEVNFRKRSIPSSLISAAIERLDSSTMDLAMGLEPGMDPTPGEEELPSLQELEAQMGLKVTDLDGLIPPAPPTN